MPPIQLDTPPDPAANRTRTRLPLEVPASDPNRKTFTPDVPNLMELPLDVFGRGRLRHSHKSYAEVAFDYAQATGTVGS